MFVQSLLLSVAMAAPPQAPTPPQAPPVKAVCRCGCEPDKYGECPCEKCPAKAKDYPACYEAAKASRVTLVVGCDAKADYSTPALAGHKPGVYTLAWNPTLGTVVIDPLVVPKQMEAPVKMWVKQCVNGVCRMVEVTK